MSGKLIFNGKKAKLSDVDKDAKIIIHLEKEVHHLKQEIVNINQKSESDWQTVLMLESRSAGGGFNWHIFDFLTLFSL